MCAREEISCRRGRYSLLASELTSDALLGIPAEKVKDDDAFSRKHPGYLKHLESLPGCNIRPHCRSELHDHSEYIRDFIFIGLG